ncbi:MAG: hypothetical protein ABSB88_04920 [Bryobacteraceae bacterium]|jgi:hypothetical protein
MLLSNGDPLEGIAILNGEPPDLIFLSVRLPQDLVALAPVIIREVEREKSLRP